MFKIICLLVFIILEVPFAIKFMQAKKNFDIIRQTAIIIIMLIILIIMFAVYKIGLFMLG